MKQLQEYLTSGMGIGLNTVIGVSTVECARRQAVARRQEVHEDKWRREDKSQAAARRQATSGGAETTQKRQGPRGQWDQLQEHPTVRKFEDDDGVTTTGPKGAEIIGTTRAIGPTSRIPDVGHG